MKLKSIVVVSAACALSLGTAVASSGMETSKTNSRADMQELQMRSNQIEATLNQNEGSVLASKPYLGDDWTKQITLSGELNVDAKWRTKHGPTSDNPNGNSMFQNSHYSDIYLNNSQVDLDAYINSWTMAHVSLAGRDPQLVDERNRSDINDDAPINLDEAYITVGDLHKYPVYGTFGRQYVPFGVYQRHPIEYSLDQFLSQTQATAAKVGFAMPMGLKGSVYTFRGVEDGANGTNDADYQINNFGGELRFASKQNVGSTPFNYNFGVGYLNNMRDVDYIAEMTEGSFSGNSIVTNSVGALSVDGKVGTGPFALRANYVTALSDFESSGDLDGDSPWAFGIAGDYSFKVMDHDSTFTLMYQQSGETADLGIPKRRYGGQYSVGVLKDTTLTFLLIQDQNFDEYADGNATPKVSEYATEGAVRLSVDF